MSTEKTSLYYKDGSSDKVYHCQLEEVVGKKFIVNFQYGRRGQSLTSGTKTSSPVPFEQAKKIYDKLVKEKTGKGYSTGEEGTPFQGTDKAGEVSGLTPQLLNPIDMDQVQQLLRDDNWLMQEKHDGVRLMVHYDGAMVIGSNRKGLVVSIPSPVVMSIRNMVGDVSSVTLDGELVGDTFWIFDLLELNGQNLRKLPFLNRFILLADLIIRAELPTPSINGVAIAGQVEDKTRMFETIKARRGEGVVFKHKESLYIPGRPNSGGNQVKFKFKASGTFEVIAIKEGKRSAAIVARQDSAIVPTDYVKVGVGFVTIPVNHTIPKPGQFVEVEYLYAYPGGSLFQPVYKGIRNDKDKPDEISTLKFKAGPEDEQEA